MAIKIDEDDKEDSKDNDLILVPATCEMIFPPGWSVSNGLSCWIPKSLVPEKIPEPEPVKEEAPVKAKEPQEASSWCPLIYFNYQCYSASFLSRQRLASLPKSIGPGPVSLVMRTIVSRILSSSYKSASILRRLEMKAEKPRKGFVTENLKGKSKVVDLKADIEVPTRADQVNEPLKVFKNCHSRTLKTSFFQVDDYLREICRKLGACPYLVCATLYENTDCPASCNSRPKTEFHAAEQAHIKYRDSRAKRIRKQMAAMARRSHNNKQSSGGGGGGNSSSDDSDPISRSTSPDSSERRSSRPKRATRKEWENILPRSEIKTRGARLPDYKLHLKIRPSRKEQSVIDRTSLRESIGFDKKGLRRQRGGRGQDQVGGPIKIKAAFKLGHVPHQQRSGGKNGMRKTLMQQKLAALQQRQQQSLGPPPIRILQLRTNPEGWTSQVSLLNTMLEKRYGLSFDLRGH